MEKEFLNLLNLYLIVLRKEDYMSKEKMLQ